MFGYLGLFSPPTSSGNYGLNWVVHLLLSFVQGLSCTLEMVYNIANFNMSLYISDSVLVGSECGVIMVQIFLV